MSPLMPRQYRPDPQASANAHKYVPAGVQQALDRQMQSVPEHLKRQLAGGDPRFVSGRAEQALAQHLEKVVPNHLKDYASAYVQQSIVNPGPSAHTPRQPITTPHPAPTPDQRKRAHSGFIPTEQANAQFLDLFQPDDPKNHNEQASNSPQPQASSGEYNSSYDFILNPAKPPKKPLISPQSMASRILIALAGLFVLMVLLAAGLRFLRGNGGSATSMLFVAQTQTELMRIADLGLEQTQDQFTKNLAVTTKLGVQSDRQELLAYLGRQGVIVKEEQLGLAQNANTDQELQAALSAGNYDATFKSILQKSLNSYSASLSRTYDASKNEAARELLKQQYDSAQLLLAQSKQQG